MSFRLLMASYDWVILELKIGQTVEEKWELELKHFS